MRKTLAIAVLALAGFFGVAACTTAPQSPPQTAPQSPPQTAPQSPPQTAPQSPPQTAPQSPPQSSSSSQEVGATKVVTDETFEGEVLKSDKPVIVYYWAEWCGPCRMVAPVLEEIATEHADKIDVVTLNIDENPAVPQRYGIVTIPTMDVFSNGQVVKQIVGAKPKSALLRELAEFI